MIQNEKLRRKPGKSEAIIENKGNYTVEIQGRSEKSLPLAFFWKIGYTNNIN